MRDRPLGTDTSIVSQGILWKHQVWWGRLRDDAEEEPDWPQEMDQS